MLIMHFVFLRFEFFGFFYCGKHLVSFACRKELQELKLLPLHTTEMVLGLCCLFPAIPQTLFIRTQQVQAGSQQKNLTFV